MEIIGILLDKKAKLNIPNNDGEIPFDYFTSDMKKQFGLDKVLVINPRTNQWNRESNNIYLNFIFCLSK